MAVVVSPPPPKTDGKFDDWIYLFWKKVISAEGAGGVVYQSTSKSTSVTLDTKCGTIFMDGEALNDSTSVSFTLYNTYIEATDVIALTMRNGASFGSYLTQVEYTNTGQCSIALRNISGGTLSEYVQLNFAIIKAYNS